MPRAVNGASGPVAHPDYELTVRMLNDLKQFWISKHNASEVDPIKFSRLGLVALTQWAAIVAVDIGMTVEQFTAVCRANFESAHEQAPRFGE